MTRVLFDTTFLVDAERAGDALDDVIDDNDDVAIAAVTIAELRVGALLATGRRKAARSAYVDDVVSTIPVLDYDVEVAGPCRTPARGSIPGEATRRARPDHRRSCRGDRTDDSQQGRQGALQRPARRRGHRHLTHRALLNSVDWLQGGHVGRRCSISRREAKE